MASGVGPAPRAPRGVVARRVARRSRVHRTCPSRSLTPGTRPLRPRGPGLDITLRGRGRGPGLGARCRGEPGDVWEGTGMLSRIADMPAGTLGFEAIGRFD